MFTIILNLSATLPMCKQFRTLAIFSLIFSRGDMRASLHPPLPGMFRYTSSARHPQICTNIWIEQMCIKSSMCRLEQCSQYPWTIWKSCNLYLCALCFMHSSNTWMDVWQMGLMSRAESCNLAALLVLPSDPMALMTTSFESCWVKNSISFNLILTIGHNWIQNMALNKY